MLLGNRSVLHKSPLRRFSGTTLSGDRSNFGGNGALRDRFIGGLNAISGGIPCGHLAPSSWSLPQTSGGISAFTTCQGQGGITIDMAAGVGISGPAQGSGIASGALLGVFGMEAIATGVSSTIADLVGLGAADGASTGYGMATGSVFAAIGIAGQSTGFADAYATGTLSVSSSGVAAGHGSADGSLAALTSMVGMAIGVSDAVASLVGAWSMAGASFGIGIAVGGQLDGDGHLSGTVTGIGGLVGSPYAKGSMSGSTVAATGDLTADEVAEAVWSYQR